MQDAGAPWSPRLGDYVQVSITGDIGEVTEVIGADADQQFVISIWPPPDSAQHVVGTIMHRACTRDDLTPARMP